MSIFAERLRQARHDAALTQLQLGNKVGITYARITQYENDQGTPSFETLIKLAQVLHVSVDWLSGRWEESP